MTSDSAGSAVPAAARQPAAAGAPDAAARPVATVSAAAHSAAAAQAAAPPAPPAQQPAALPRMRRPPVIAAAQAAPAKEVEPPAADTRAQPPAPLPLLRMVCWEVAIMIGLLAVGRPWPEVAGICASAAVLLALTAARVRGTWASTILLRWTGLGLRRRIHDLSAERDRPGALLRALAPGSRITVTELGGAPAGTISSPDELLTVLRPVDAGVRELAEAALDGSLRPEADDRGPELGLRLVLHRGPYRGPGGHTQTRAWLALRAHREVDVLVDEDLRVGLANLLRKTRKKLATASVTVQALSAQEIASTLAALTHIGPGRELLRERWKSFATGPVSQVGLRVGGLGELPAPHRMAALDRLFAVVPSIAVTAAVSTATDPAADAAVLRVAAPAEATVTSAADHLTQLGPRLGLHLERLDGRHASAVAASLPIGGVSP